MARPHDITDLYLAPVVLGIDAELATLGHLTPDQLLTYIAVATNREPRFMSERRRYFLEAITHHHEMHGWRATCDPRGLRLTHRGRYVVLGLPANVVSYLGLADQPVGARG
jgi:hypothetical protein